MLVRTCACTCISRIVSCGSHSNTILFSLKICCLALSLPPSPFYLSLSLSLSLCPPLFPSFFSLTLPPFPSCTLCTSIPFIPPLVVLINATVHIYLQAQEEKRRQLLLKARAAKAKKKQARALQCSMNQMLTQRKVAQRQRRERERMLVKQAKERQDKLNRHKEAEVCSVHGRGNKYLL